MYRTFDPPQMRLTANAWQPTHHTTSFNTQVEMYQKAESQDSFFNMKALAPRQRPMSEATDFDTDFEDEDSEIEENSPRLSMGSVSCPSLL
jgi:hypothetical protein